MNILLNSNYTYHTNTTKPFMMLFTRQLLLVLLLQSFCTAAGTDDASPPIRKRTQHRHSSSNSSTHLRGGSTRDTDNFDPFIGVPRELSADSLPMHKSTDRNMSLSMPTTSAPSLTPTTITTTALVFIGETELPVTSSPTTTPPTPKPTLISTSVMTTVMTMEEGAFHVGDGIEVEPATEMPVSSRKPTLLPTSVLI